MAHCKICGKTFPAAKSVRAHIQSMTDGDHEGIGYSTADPHIGDDSNADPAQPDKQSFDKNTENTSPMSNEENPLTAEPPQSEQSSNSEELDCPNCRHGVGTLEEIVEFREEHGQVHCGDCGYRLRVQE